MLALFGKKTKASPDEVAHTFVKNLLESVEQGFPEVAGIINDHSAFLRCPNISEEDHGRFLMVIIAANFDFMAQQLPDGKEKPIIKACVIEFAQIFDMPVDQFAGLVQRYRSHMSKVNRPSKNPLYAMGKSVFHKYHLNVHQEPFFKDMNTPNPVFLKSMDRIMESFIWDWAAFQERFKFG